MSEVILKMCSITKQFSALQALKEVDFELRKGEVHVLLGENGAGKSILMNILTGVCKKDSGKIMVKNQEVDISSPEYAQKLGIAAIFQDSNLFDRFSIAENIFVNNKPIRNRVLKTVDYKRMCKDSRAILDMLGFEMDPEVLVENLNYGQKRIIEIAKAISRKSDILILDEPGASLSQKEIEGLFKVIRSLKENGVSIVYITHRLEEVFRIADRISILRDGKMIETRRVEDFSINGILQCMSGANYKNRYPKLEVRKGKDVLKVRNLGVQNYIRDVSFSLRKQEILGFAGLLGSGRSKITRSILGLEQITSGEFYISGKKVKIKSPFDAINMGIGYISEDRDEKIFDNLNVLSNIKSANYHNDRSFIVNSSDEYKEMQEYLNKFNVKNHYVSECMRSLSGGNQQKIVLARWILTNSKIFILDEPTVGLDIVSKVDVYNIINNLVREGTSVIMISSDLEELVGMCDRVLVIYDGTIVKELDRNELSVKNILYYAVGGNTGNQR